MENNLHKGHRERLKQRFLKEGSLENFTDHQVLELALFYIIQQKDTNELAHALINHFGSLKAVMDADPSLLIEFPGITENGVVFLKFLPEVSGRYARCSQPNILVDGIQGYINYCVSLFANVKTEKIAVICLDTKCNFLDCRLFGEFSMRDSTQFDIRDIARFILNHECDTVIIAHNHPDGGLQLSHEDVAVTKSLVRGLAGLKITVADHLLIASGTGISVRKSQLIPFLFS
jgi:DNA repair protein RadC